MLYGDMKESSMNTVPLPAARANCLQVVIRYLHGQHFRSDTDRCWDEMVEVYSLAAQYQVDLLCQRIALLVPSLVSAREFGDLLNAAIPRRAEELLKASVEAMNKVLVFDSMSFQGWSKESIEYCLENVQFHPNVTETMVAEAVLSAASSSGSVTAEGENGQNASVRGDCTVEGSDDCLVVEVVPSCSGVERKTLGSYTVTLRPMMTKSAQRHFLIRIRANGSEELWL
ncbi:hypothetical protein CBR_g53746 [Chara braunii]|uniref:BTB domain-containing protein n=1 Tax=Chara braunii TaxID=69332 RepID=A0A388MBG7_CHABU|nr:hypothetical protein CBR_g53746 [Chara braunii]|eukprot:GBG91855.1 hypothetical protein CBR_g53746 [Chara braunii]